MKTKIRLQISGLLNTRFELPTDGLEEKLSSIKKAWEEQEEIILEGLIKITGLNFLQNYVDVFLINPHSSWSISNPTIVGTDGDTDKTIRLIIHELIHKLTFDNTAEVDWHKEIQKMFNAEDKRVANHVMVHAILEAMYIDILQKTEEIDKDILDTQNMFVYKRAWEIVKEKGYKNIIDQLKSLK